MERNIHNVDQVTHETELDKVNILLSNGWIIVDTFASTYHEDSDYSILTYSLGHLIKDNSNENDWPLD
jgi:hypothetical protein